MNREQREQAISQIKTLHSQGKTIVEACKELGVNNQTYYSWMRGPKKKGSKQIATSTGTSRKPFITLDLSTFDFELREGSLTVFKK